MLSRIAESFFWLGRYVERAEATSWIPVRTMNQLLSDVPSYLPGAMALPAEAMTGPAD